MSFEQLVIICLLLIDCCFVAGLGALCAVIVHRVKTDNLLDRTVTILETLSNHYSNQNKAVMAIAYWLEWVSTGGNREQ